MASNDDEIREVPARSTVFIQIHLLLNQSNHAIDEWCRTIDPGFLGCLELLVAWQSEKAVSQTRTMPRRRSTSGTRREAQMLEDCVIRTGSRSSRRHGQGPFDVRFAEIDAGHESWRDAL
eukprot:IDg5624t1